MSNVVLRPSMVLFSLRSSLVKLSSGHHWLCGPQVTYVHVVLRPSLLMLSSGHRMVKFKICSLNGSLGSQHVLLKI